MIEMYTKNGWLKVKVLSAQDFEGYDYNKPSDNWELVDLPDGFRLWTPKWSLRKAK